MAIQKIKVPDIGEYRGVTVIELHLKPGQLIKAEDTMFTLETDKATMEVPSALAGLVKTVTLKVGDKVSAGDSIGEIEVSAMDKPAAKGAPVQVATVPQETQAAVAVEKPESPHVLTVPEPKDAGVFQNTHASPGVRRLARELDVDLALIRATGRKGRVTEEDLTGHLKNLLHSPQGSAGVLPDPVVDFAKFGPIETKPLSRVKKISGANLARNWQRIPHISFFEEADVTDLEAFRQHKKSETQTLGIKLTLMAFVVKAVAKALSLFPNVNSSLVAEQQIFKQYVHIGIAVDTPQGLLVPVILQADQKSVYELAKELSALAEQAKAGKLSGSQMQGGCFTISSLGAVGSQHFTPIVNMPEVGILGVSKTKYKPVYDEASGDFVPRLMMPLSLSVDHRAVDGAQASRFVATIASYLSDVREVLL